MLKIQEYSDITSIDLRDPATWLTLKQLRQDIRDAIFDFGEDMDAEQLKILEADLMDVEQRIQTGEEWVFPW